MISRQEIEKVKSLTGLDVPVYLNGDKGLFISNAYFGVGDYGLDIMPDDEYTMGMFDLIDFLEDKHLKYYHVGLPDNIIGLRDKESDKHIRKKFKEYGVNLEVNNRVFEIFVLLHELGHAHQLFVEYKGSVSKYIQDRIRLNEDIERRE